jgi:hypothetical protein
MAISHAQLQPRRGLSRRILSGKCRLIIESERLCFFGTDECASRPAGRRFVAAIAVVSCTVISERVATRRSACQSVQRLGNGSQAASAIRRFVIYRAAERARSAAVTRLVSRGAQAIAWSNAVEGSRHYGHHQWSPLAAVHIGGACDHRVVAARDETSGGDPVAALRDPDAGGAVVGGHVHHRRPVCPAPRLREWAAGLERTALRPVDR